MRSFFTITPSGLATSARAEHSSLKEAEKALRDQGPGDYLIVEVVRQAHVEPVPESMKVRLEATRTRSPKDPNAPKRSRSRKPRASQTSSM